MDFPRHIPSAPSLVLVALLACGPASSDGSGGLAESADPAADTDPAGDPVGGGDPGSDSSVASTPSPPSTWAYTCPDGPRLTVHYREDEARVTLPTRELVLPAAPSASGARYASGDTVFWDRAGEALVEVGSERYTGCRGRQAETPEDAVRLLGFDFRGIGQEPGWIVDVDADRQMRWIGDYGTVRFATEAPTASESPDGGVTWTARSEGHEIIVEARPEACRDAMSGRPFSHTVRVTADGRDYTGCGGWLNDR